MIQTGAYVTPLLPKALNTALAGQPYRCAEAHQHLATGPSVRNAGSQAGWGITAKPDNPLSSFAGTPSILLGGSVCDPKIVVY